MTNKLTFRELYQRELDKPTPAQKFVSEIAKATKRKETTVRMWLSGRQQPDDLARSIIAAKCGADAASLFSNQDETTNS